MYNRNNSKDFTNNFIFKRMLAIANIRDKDKIVEIFSSKNYPITKSKIDSYRIINTDNPRIRPMPSEALVAFMNGLLLLAEDNKLVCYLIDD